MPIAVYTNDGFEPLYPPSPYADRTDQTNQSETFERPGANAGVISGVCIASCFLESDDDTIRVRSDVADPTVL